MKTSIILHNIDQDELKVLLNDIIEQKLRQHLPAQDRSSEYLTRDEVSKLLRISLPTLHELTRTGLLQGYRIGGRVLYKRNEVEDSMKPIQSSKYERSK